MATQLIEPKNWESFFNEFSRAHEGETAVLHEIGPEIGDQEEADRLEFVGISSDAKDNEPATITVMLGAEPGDHLERTISEPTRVYVLEGDGASGVTAVQIERQDGPKLILELRKLLVLSGAN